MVTMVGGVLPKYFIPHKLQRKHWKQKKNFVYTKKKTCRNDLDDIFREKKSLIVKKYVLFEENA